LLFIFLLSFDRFPGKIAAFLRENGSFLSVAIV
jgi:hypothetical protein